MGFGNWAWVSCVLSSPCTGSSLAGNPDLYVPRLLAVSYEPSIMLVIILLWHVLWRIDPKKRNYESFWSTYQYIGGVIVVCIGLIYLMVLGHLLHIGSIRFAPIALTAYGIMFMLIANVLPRLQPNWMDRIPHSMDFIEYGMLESHASSRRAIRYSDRNSDHRSCLGFTNK